MATPKDTDVVGLTANDFNFSVVIELDTGVKLLALDGTEGNELGVINGIYKDNSFIIEPAHA